MQINPVFSLRAKRNSRLRTLVAGISIAIKRSYGFWICCFVLVVNIYQAKYTKTSEKRGLFMDFLPKESKPH